MIIRENESREEYVMSVAKAMMSAARTAPKGCGVDNLEIAAIGSVAPFPSCPQDA